METAVSSPPDGDKPRAPRFEAFVMTGDAILNLSRTTHSPEVLPIHSKRRRAFQQQQLASQQSQQQQQHQQQQKQEQQTQHYVPQPSNSLPTSPSELVERGQKPWEPETSPPAVSTPIRSSKSEEALTIVHMEEKKPPSKPEECAKVSKNEDCAKVSNDKLVETGGKEPDRIVWTYNAPLTGLSEKEMRRYEADQFWLNTRTESSSKQQKQTTQADEKIVNNSSETAADEGVGSRLASCDTQIVREIAGEQPASAKVIEEEEPSLVANSPVRPPMTRSSTEESESDADSLQSVHFSPKGVDMPSAIRLAKRYRINLLRLPLCSILDMWVM